MRENLPSGPPRTEHAHLPQTTAGEIAAGEALAALRFGEAPRVGVLGDSRCGKTEALRRLIDEYKRRSPGAVFIIDTKEKDPQFEGQLRRDLADYEMNPPDPDPAKRVIVFRGDPFSVDGKHSLDPESIARLQMARARRGKPSLVVYDELDIAAEGGQWKENPSTIAWAFGKGGSQGAASFWGTQETEAVPRQAFNQSSAILCFRMMGNPLRLLGKRGYLEGGVEKVIPRLPGDELPKHQRGYFVFLRRGRPWDGRIYRFAPRAARAGTVGAVARAA